MYLSFVIYISQVVFMFLKLQCTSNSMLLLSINMIYVFLRQIIYKKLCLFRRNQRSIIRKQITKPRINVTRINVKTQMNRRTTMSCIFNQALLWRTQSKTPSFVFAKCQILARIYLLCLSNIKCEFISCQSIGWKKYFVYDRIYVDVHDFNPFS